MENVNLVVGDVNSRLSLAHAFSRGFKIKMTQDTDARIRSPEDQVIPNPGHDGTHDHTDFCFRRSIHILPFDLLGAPTLRLLAVAADLLALWIRLPFLKLQIVPNGVVTTNLLPADRSSANCLRDRLPRTTFQLRCRSCVYDL